MRPPSDADAHSAIRTLIAWIGDDPNREGLIETPRRVMDAWRAEWGSGYEEHPSLHVKMFREQLRVDHPMLHEMIVMRGISFQSMCEHHMAPFYGTATIAYIPSNSKIVGASKMARILNSFSRKLSVQERVTNEVADFMYEHVAPLGVGVLLNGQHMCMISRGVNQPGSVMTTSALRGAFFDNQSTRSEFLRLATT